MNEIVGGVFGCYLSRVNNIIERNNTSYFFQSLKYASKT